jgi:hypothetical protein
MGLYLLWINQEIHEEVLFPNPLNSLVSPKPTPPGYLPGGGYPGWTSVHNTLPASSAAYLSTAHLCLLHWPPLPPPPPQAVRAGSVAVRGFVHRRLRFWQCDFDFGSVAPSHNGARSSLSGGRPISAAKVTDG